MIALRDRVTATVDPAMHEDQVRVSIRLKDGRTVSQFVEHAVGSTLNPMTDAALDAKFMDLSEGVLPKIRAQRVLDLCHRVESLPDASAIPKAASRA